MEQVFINGAELAYFSACVFLFIGIAAALGLKIIKANAVHTYVFFVVSMLILALYLLLWHFAFGRGGQETQATAGLATINTGLGQWGQILGGGIGGAVLTLVVHEAISRWRRPKFSVRFDKKDCRKASIPRDSYWLRLRVANSGRSVARNCVGRIVKFIDDSGERTDLDPVMLHWVSTDWGKPAAPFFDTIALNRKEDALLDVVITKADSGRKAFVFTYGFLDGTNTTDILSGNSKIHVTIYGDDVKPCTKKYSIIWEGDNYNNIKLKEE